MRYTIVENIVEPLDSKWPRTKTEAIKESIRKWNFILGTLNKYVDDNDFNGLEADGNSCALCKLYVQKDNNCYKCPIYSKTRMQFCENTPFVDFAKALYLENKIKYCKKEIKFLESLL